MKTSFAAFLPVLFLPAATPATTYEVLPGDEGNDVRFRSEAPLESFEGSTDRVAGRFEADLRGPDRPIDVTIEVDLASLDTGIRLRNRHMRENHLHTAAYPKALFHGTRAEGVPAEGIPPGERAELRVAGDFSLHGITRPLEARIVVLHRKDGFLEISGRFVVKLSDFEIPRPRFLFLKLDEVQHVSLHLTARPVPAKSEDSE